METYTLLSVSKFFNRFRKYSILLIIICLQCFSAEFVFSQNNKNEKVTICFRGKTIEVRKVFLTNYLKRGATLGQCDETDEVDGRRIIAICFNGRTLIVRKSKLNNWLNRGATVGPCEDDDRWKLETICFRGDTYNVRKSKLDIYLKYGAYQGSCDDPSIYTGVITPYIPQVGKINENIGSDLTSLYEVFKNTGSAASNEIFTSSNGSDVLIDILAVDGKTEDVVSFLTGDFGIIDFADYELSRSYGLNKNLTTVLFPIDRLPELNLRDDIIKIVRPVYTPITNTGAIISQGDRAQRSDMARRAFEVYGDGIKVGALSDGFDALGLNGAATDVSNGDLPGAEYSVYNTPVVVIEEYPVDLRSQYSSFDEGRAMLQIIHDVAPGAALFFHSGVKSSGVMTEGIFKLQSEGCEIIVDDITHYKEPWFRDGNIALAVDSVENMGVKYFTSAGNFGDNSYEAQFNPAIDTISNHDFNPLGGNSNVDTKQKIRFKNGFVRIVLQWDDNYYSVYPYTGAEVDLDIYLITDGGDTLVYNNDNNIGGDPFTMMTFNVNDGAASSNIVIHKASGERNVRFKYIVFESTELRFLEYTNGSSTITGHANAVGANTVGAVLYSNSPAYGNEPSIASFSSRGGLIMHGESTPRNKPNIAAPNGVNTSVNLGKIYNDDGTELNIDGDNFPNFFGTSASAPHAAGAAALILSSFNKYGVSGDVIDLLQTTAIDIEDPGMDFASGAGFLKVDSAIMTFANPIPEISELIVPGGVSPGLEEFEVTVKGKYLTPGARVLFNGDTIPEGNTLYVNSSQIKAIIPEFVVEDDPPLYAINSSITPNENDGGASNPLYFYRGRKPLITVQAEYKTKKFGERIPEFTASILVDTIPLSETGITADSLGLTNLTFETAATSMSNLGNHRIHMVDITSELDPTLLEYYDYTFKDTVLLIEKLPIEIIPNDMIANYGEKIEGISYRYNFDSTNFDPEDIPEFIEILEREYKSTFTDEDSIAIINRSRFLVDRSRFLINGSAWTATDRALKNRSRFLVNGNVVIDIDTTLLSDYQNHPEGTIADRSRFLINGQSLVNGEARYVLPDRSRFLINDGALVNADGSLEGFDAIVVIADVEDSLVNNIYSLNLISGLEVTWGSDSLHYIVPGAFLSPKSQNLEITYGLGDLEILPATLTVTVDDKEIYLGDPLPQFTTTITGYEYEENDSIVFSSITYTPSDYQSTGTYDIIPSFEFRDLVNYVFDPDPIISGTLTVNSIINGKIAMTRVHIGDDSEDLILINSDGTNPTVLVSEHEWIRDPDFSPDGTQVVYTVWDALGSNLWKINSDGTGLAQLTSDNNSQQADFSPDGTKITFVNHGDIAITDADGIAPPTILHVRGSWPTYSPNGQEIYFNNNGTLLKVNLTTNDTSSISSDINSKPVFLRDGSKLIVTRESNVSGNDIIFMNSDGSEEVILHSGDVGGVAVSPDNTKIAFIKDSVDDGYGYNYDLYEMNLDGSNIHLLFTQNDSGYNLSQPAWSIYPDDIQIPDPNFEQALLDLGIDSDGEINQQIWRSDAEVVTKLNLTDPPNNIYLPNVDEKISDLTGIEAFVNLRFLSCRENQLSNLNVTQNTELTHLRASGNNITDLDVSNNVKLDTLWVGFNQLTSIDVSNLSQMTVFYCNNNLLENLDLTNNTKLTALWCGINPNLYELDVSHNPDLSLLGCYGMNLDSLDVSSNQELTNLRCYWNNLTYLDLSNNPNLEMVRCYHNQLTYLDLRNGNNAILDTLQAEDNNLSCINVDDETADHSGWQVDPGVRYSNNCKGIVYIQDIYFEAELVAQGIDSDGEINHQILRSDAESVDSLIVEHLYMGSIQGIEGFINLKYLSCAYNPLTSVDLSANTSLEIFSCISNNLESLDLSHNTALRILNCENNSLTNLDLSNNSNLIGLGCDNNQLDSLDLSQNPELQVLTCSNNGLLWLNVADNPILNGLICSNNNLSDLEVSQKPLLGHLDCDNNLLTSLYVSESIGLTWLNCANNELTSLDVSQNDSLSLLACHDNLITNLDLSSNFKLYQIFCQNNQLTSLDIRNGNNDFIHNFDASNNIDLTCISVDDETADHSGWGWNTDIGVIFSNDCSISVPVSIPDPNFEQALIDLEIDSDGIINQQISRYDVQIVTSLDVSDPENNPALPNVSEKIEDLTGIEAFVNLTNLDCEYNLLTNLNLSQNIALEALVCQQNLLTSLNVSSNSSLEFLMCGHNQLPGLDVSQNTSLTSLYCDFNQLTSLDVSQNTLLINLDCWDNQLTSIDVSHNPELRYLNLRENNLSSLDVSQNTALRQLYCLRNQLISLDVSNNTALYNLWCNGNQLTSLDVTNNTELIELICDFNKLASLDISQNTSLDRLICRVNYITELDITNNTALTNLDCHSNELVSLDLRNSNNLSLNTLDASNNQLTCINVDDEGADHSDWIVDDGVILSNDCSVSHSPSSSRYITGAVTSSFDSSPLTGASIVIKGTSVGSVTDLNGNYGISVYGDDEIFVCSFIGYETIEEPTGNRSTVNMPLDPIPGFEAILAPDGATTIEDGNVRLYPIPTYGTLYIEFTDPLVDLSEVSITVYNDQPAIVHVPISPSILVNGFEIDFLGLPGPDYYYYVQLYDGIRVRVFRVAYQYD